MAVDEISRRLMATVNKYAAIAFPNYRFEFVWGAQVRLLVHRPKGTTDVRKLSGAESKLFTLILTMSQLMFKPKSKRLSLLILDEPSASFSKETLERFHRLLPYMQQLIPSILIVTPKSEERYPGAHEYTVVRDASGATVKKGHPSEITA
jgi:ABC-type sugar transport system ATPase subunit